MSEEKVLQKLETNQLTHADGPFHWSSGVKSTGEEEEKKKKYCKSKGLMGKVEKQDCRHQ